MTVRAVLDTSAMLAYASVDQAIPVSEFVRSVMEENEAIGEDPDDVEAWAEISQVGIPTSTFIAAYAQSDAFGRNLLADLASDLAVAEELADTERSTFVFLPMAGVADILEASELERQWPGRGEAIHHALRLNAELATFDPPKKPVPRLQLTDLSMTWDD
ncbi:hypothetical protein AB0M47_21425 [Hamadaea sp. NPDC051192]|uniref:hypothetical protein n=1 Tax=Hamadaea sp. NPDC051192 TaxID=3154940 RepID=UPI003431FF98